MSLFDKNPLWMPKGSVHAIVTLVAVVVTFAMYYQGITVTQSQEVLTAGILGGYSLYRQGLFTKGGTK